MILLALILAQTAPAPLPAPVDVEASEIQVVGAKLRKLRLDIAMSGGRIVACRPLVSSGDPFIDREACKAADSCVASGVKQQARLLPCIDNRIRAVVLSARK